MIILHAGFHKRHLLLWGETPPAAPSPRAAGKPPRPSPYDEGSQALRAALREAGLPRLDLRSEPAVAWLPTTRGRPLPSSPLIAPSPAGKAKLQPSTITVLPLTALQAVDLLCLCLGKDVLAPRVVIGPDLAFWARAMQYAGALVAREQFLPAVAVEDERYRACWEPVPGSQEEARLSGLAALMPEACRALGGAGSPPDRAPRALLREFIAVMVDGLVRAAQPPAPPAAIDSAHDWWLEALRLEDGRLEGGAAAWAEFHRQQQEWWRPLAVAAASPVRLCLRLEEPAPEAPDDEWYLRYLLQAVDDPSLLAPAALALAPGAPEAALLHREGVDLREYVLTALGQAAGICPDVAASLRATQPEGCPLDAAGAYQFLTHTAPVLEQAGFGVMLPAWWVGKGPRLRLTARGHARSPRLAAPGSLSLDAVLEVDWEVALGDETVSLEEIEALAAHKAPLVRVRGQWMEADAARLRAAADFLAQRRQHRASLRDLMQWSLGQSPMAELVEVEGVTASGWAAELLDRLQSADGYEQLPAPDGFVGELRHYQQRGFSWLAFFRRWGLGACLADDMGLGKTIQALALLQREWEAGDRRPALLICPTSVVRNWQKEAARFTPDLPVMIHHGGGRRKGERFREEAERHALVISSYALLHRDAEALGSVGWAGVILDEAQNVKNPETKQARAARALRAGYRFALTGTPVENSVGDLWSLMEFLNPGLLGTQADFKRRFFIPIQAQRDQAAAERLRRLTEPFLLRRVKTDQTIISDLPDKLEFKVFCTLTKEQASLYAAVAKEATEGIAEAEGINRRGLVLATLSKLKQVCNHPAQFLGDGSSLPGRSGKLARLTEMLEEVLSVGDRALIFSQFAEMGELLRAHLQETFGQEVLFLHGGVPRKRRDEMIARFQEQDDGPRLFILSLKAGGLGLNLTRANHVFHFDRWWNPAVENQATDRAFRIGQTRDVQVHKFLCAGTLEEKIDEMIERKQEVAQRIVGAGEAWLTELSTAELRELFALRKEAVSA
jgi:hypothetical protein